MKTNQSPSAALVVSTTVTGAIKCKGDRTGAVVASYTGGTGPYRFLGLLIMAIVFLSGVPAGTYTANVTDECRISVSSESTISESASMCT